MSSCSKRINPNSHKDVIGIADPEADPVLEPRQTYFFLLSFYLLFLPPYPPPSLLHHRSLTEEEANVFRATFRSTGYGRGVAELFFFHECLHVACVLHTSENVAIPFRATFPSIHLPWGNMICVCRYMLAEVFL